MEDKVKQVIIIRKELKMRRGKEISQGAHAAMAFLTRRLTGSPSAYAEGCPPINGRKAHKLYSLFTTAEESQWIEGSFTKITCQVETLEEIQALHEAALAAGLESNLMIDNGATEFHNVPTVTALAIGPDRSSKIDPITGGLKLL